MKKFLAILLLASPLMAQVSPPSGTSRTAGRFIAYNYGVWSLPIYSFPSGTGSKTFTLSNSTVQLGDSRTIMPFNTNAQVYVGTELVTLSAVGAGCIKGSTAPGSCSLTATFSNPHTNADRVSSATFGLQEALNDAGASGGGAVTVDTAWAGLGGTTDIVNAATLPSNTKVEDMRTGGGGSGSGTVSAGTAGQLAGYGANGTTVEGMTNQCPFVTDPPYNAACDGSTDDSAAIQAAMDANGCVQLPRSTPGNLQQCDIASGIVQNNGSLTIIGNGSYMPYSGTETGISVGTGTGSFIPNITIKNILLDAVSPTGTPTIIDTTNANISILEGVYDLGSGPSGYTFVDDGSVHSVFNNVGGGDALSESDNGIYSNVGFQSFNLSGNGNYTFNGLNVTNELDVNSAASINGYAQYATFSGTPSSGSLCTFSSSDSPSCTSYGPVLPGIVYSAAGTPLPGTTGGDDACSTIPVGAQATVSDATIPTYLGAYVSGGGVVAGVRCNGTIWQTN